MIHSPLVVGSSPTEVPTSTLKSINSGHSQNSSIWLQNGHSRHLAFSDLLEVTYESISHINSIKQSFIIDHARIKAKYFLRTDYHLLA